MLRKTLFAVALALLAAATAAAQDAETQRKAVETRQGLMKVVVWNVVPMGAMAKERVPFDAAAFALHAGRVAFLLDMAPEAFRLDTRSSDTRSEALPAIWENLAEFEELARRAADKARAAETAAREGDFDDARAAFLEMGEACKACHDEFREES